MSQDPDEEQHPDLADLGRQSFDAFADGQKQLAVWVFIIILISWYPDWRTIIGVWLVLVGAGGLIFHFFAHKK